MMKKRDVKRLTALFVAAVLVFCMAPSVFCIGTQKLLHVGGSLLEELSYDGHWTDGDWWTGGDYWTDGDWWTGGDWWTDGDWWTGGDWWTDGDWWTGGNISDFVGPHIINPAIGILPRPNSQDGEGDGDGNKDVPQTFDDGDNITDTTVAEDERTEQDKDGVTADDDVSVPENDVGHPKDDGVIPYDDTEPPDEDDVDHSKDDGVMPYDDTVSSDEDDGPLLDGPFSAEDEDENDIPKNEGEFIKANTNTRPAKKGEVKGNENVKTEEGNVSPVPSVKGDGTSDSSPKRSLEWIWYCCGAVAAVGACTAGVVFYIKRRRRNSS